jgi:hypothetical protein
MGKNDALEGFGRGNGATNGSLGLQAVRLVDSAAAVVDR